VRQHPQTIPAVAIALERDAGLHSDKALVERAAEVIDYLARRGFEIVPKPGQGWATRFDEARRTGDWRGVSDADWIAWMNVLRQSDPAAAAAAAAEFLPTYETLARLHGLFVRADGTVTPMDKAAVEAGMIAIVERDIGPVGVTLDRGLTVELPAGAEISAPASDPDEDEEPEKDDWGVREHRADEMAACHGCRVELSGIDDPNLPLTYDDDLRTYAVVTERSTGLLVGLVECWQSEDGDWIVPRSWLVITLSAWDAKSMPKSAA
jgi:hypothetical protein